MVMARSTAWGSTASLSGAGAGARAGRVVPQPAITNAVTAATDRRAINWLAPHARAATTRRDRVSAPYSLGVRSSWYGGVVPRAPPAPGGKEEGWGGGEGKSWWVPGTHK